ncbi:hypothetical protein DFH06DRAFT_1484934 [Mycena polygramma]|nr:hypothetical protein DFH06DRAFT_1484934 [Mycena polygramma]
MRDEAVHTSFRVCPRNALSLLCPFAPTRARLEPAALSAPPDFLSASGLAAKPPSLLTDSSRRLDFAATLVRDAASQSRGARNSVPSATNCTESANASARQRRGVQVSNCQAPRPFHDTLALSAECGESPTCAPLRSTRLSAWRVRCTATRSASTHAHGDRHVSASLGRFKLDAAPPLATTPAQRRGSRGSRLIHALRRGAARAHALFRQKRPLD